MRHTLSIISRSTTAVIYEKIEGCSPSLIYQNSYPQTYHTGQRTSTLLNDNTHATSLLPVSCIPRISCDLFSTLDHHQRPSLVAMSGSFLSHSLSVLTVTYFVLAPVIHVLVNFSDEYLKHIDEPLKTISSEAWYPSKTTQPSSISFVDTVQKKLFINKILCAMFQQHLLFITFFWKFEQRHMASF